MTHKAVTANRLHDGAVVYRTAAGRWSERIEDAGLAASESESEAVLDGAWSDVERLLVVNPYVFDVALGDDGPVPQGQRETIRARGPSVATAG